jgi:hypothetical protein
MTNKRITTTREVGETDDSWVQCPVCGDDGKEGRIRARLAAIEAEARDIPAEGNMTTAYMVGYEKGKADERARAAAAVEALGSVLRLIEPIPHSVDVEQAGVQTEVALATGRATLDAYREPTDD